MSAYIWMNSFFSSIMDSTLTRASDRSRKKKANFVGFLGTNSRKKLADFAGILWEVLGQTSPKSN